jgi:penicillin amidase
MDAAKTTQQAMSIINQAGGPPQNVVFADKAGHIGWTYMGRFPKRVGFDGLVSRSWATGDSAWQGFIADEALPRLFDPADGFIVTANNRTLGSDYPYVIGHNWALGYRAFRITELLRDRQGLSEQDLLNIQLDTRSGVLDFYQRLALSELQNLSTKDLALQEIEAALKAWNGHMQTGSLGAALLNQFRTRLANAVFAKVVAACLAHDADFKYAWREMETPLRILLIQRPAGLLSKRYQDNWQRMILETLRETAEELQQQYPETRLTELSWGQTHNIRIQHPFSKVTPFLGNMMDMPTFASDGCGSFCVKILDLAHGASERLVLSPAHPEDAIFHMPGGQSGHPLSAHYRDQQLLWQNGLATPLKSQTKSHHLSVLPE